MLLPPVPMHEEARLEAVVEYDPSRPFDQDAYAPMLELARDLFGVPTAFVTFVERDTQSFVVRLGLPLCETSRDVSFCAHAVAAEEMLVVLDAASDPRFSDNPLVTGAPYIRFYAGMPLFNPSGHAVGTLCLADTLPHTSFTEPDRRHLHQLASLVTDKLELRRLDLARQNSQTRFENIAATSPDGIICANADGQITFWNAASERLFGHCAAEALGRSLDLIVPERMRKGHDGGLRRVADGGKPRLVGTTVELVARRRDGSELPVELSLSMWQEDSGVSFGAILRDITERRANEERLFRLAHHDPLTELPNRTVLRQRVEQLARGVGAACLLLVDLDGFKHVNDDLGHAAGDAVLRQVAERLRACVRTTDTVARLGGDEFALLLLGVGDPLRAGEVAETVIRSISRPLVLGNHTVHVGASVGIAGYPGDGSTSDELLSSADLALYQAKSDGRHCHRVFTTELRQATDRARAYDNELRRAADQGEFEVFYQPQVRLADRVLVGAEALLRWRHPSDGLLSPAAFMSALENRPVSIDVGRMVLRTACAQAAAWRAGGAAAFRIGVNLFGSQFRAGSLVPDVADALLTSGLPPSALELEITENILLRHDEGMIAPLQELRARGVCIAFDDYGTGYASLSMLKRFPITRLKVDQSFVRSMCHSEEDAAIVRAVLYLGRAFGFSVIAEGVETEEQAERLMRKGCEEVQGYLYGRPMPAAEFTARFALSIPPARHLEEPIPARQAEADLQPGAPALV